MGSGVAVDGYDIIFGCVEVVSCYRLAMACYVGVVAGVCVAGTIGFGFVISGLYAEILELGAYRWYPFVDSYGSDGVGYVIYGRGKDISVVVCEVGAGV